MAAARVLKSLTHTILFFLGEGLEDVGPLAGLPAFAGGAKSIRSPKHDLGIVQVVLRLPPQFAKIGGVTKWMIIYAAGKWLGR